MTERKKKVLQAVRQKPGSKIVEISQTTGIKVESIRRIVWELYSLKLAYFSFIYTPYKIPLWYPVKGNDVGVWQQLKDFVQSKELLPSNRRWLQDDKMSACVRKGVHLLYAEQEEMIATLDISYLKIEPEHATADIFAYFLNRAHEINPWAATLIETIEDSNFIETLMQLGWQKAIADGAFFKLKLAANPETEPDNS